MSKPPQPRLRVPVDNYDNYYEDMNVTKTTSNLEVRSETFDYINDPGLEFSFRYYNFTFRGASVSFVRRWNLKNISF